MKDKLGREIQKGDDIAVAVGEHGLMVGTVVDAASFAVHARFDRDLPAFFKGPYLKIITRSASLVLVAR